MARVFRDHGPESKLQDIVTAAGGDPELPPSTLQVSCMPVAEKIGASEHACPCS